MMVIPIVFADAIVKHRVMELSVLERRSARYVFVQRGFVLIAFALSLAVEPLVKRPRRNGGALCAYVPCVPTGTLL